jgi:type VII secretion-associated serine protease mycosin
VIFRKTSAAASTAVITIIIGTTASPAMADGVRNDEWHLTSLRIDDAHRVTTGAGIVVAVVDTGVDPHPDLRKNLLAGTDVTSSSGGNGQIDTNGHGTEMAGLIGAHGKSGNGGVLGIAPAAKILPVKDSNSEANAGSSEIAKGIDWAVARGAKVINVSAATGPSLELQDAVANAAAKDVVVVAGSGNKPDFLKFGYPAAMPGVLAVGASDRSGKHATFSLTGRQIQICAPGVDIESTSPKGKYSIAFGTSSSTAIVSGAATLVRARFPTLSAQGIIHRLTATATDVGKPGRDDECGFGVLNIVKALTADVPPLEPSIGASASAPAPTLSALTAAAPETEPTGNSLPAVVGGVAIAALVGGLAAFLVIRRRKTS